MINFNLLRVFHAVAHTHNVVTAAEKLYISQPAVSNAIKKIQQEYGIQLFVKSGRSLVLTKEGEELLTIADRVFDIEKELLAFIASAGAQKKLLLHLGLVTIYERSGVTRFIEAFKQLDDAVSLAVHSGNSSLLVEKLINREIDLALAGEVASFSGLERYFYKNHNVYLVVPRGHKLYGRKEFMPEELAGEHIVFKDAGSAVRFIVDRFLKEHGVETLHSTELSNFDAILEIMTHSGGISFFPDDIIASLLEDDEKFSILRPAGAPMEFRTYLYVRPVSSYPPAVRSFLEKLLARFKQFSEE